jgi:Arc/MetJ-type ribon-helix-helix transcriptional regulator
MPRLTITISDEQAALLDEKVGDNGEYESKSEAVRTFIQSGERLSQRVDELETENSRLRYQLTATNRRVDEHKELQRYVQEQWGVERRRARREERRAQAGILTKTKWMLTGMPPESDGEVSTD